MNLYKNGGGMRKRLSVAEARQGLPGIIDQVERGRPVEITRRGRPVAVLVPVREYERLTAERPSFREAYQAWRASVDPADLSGLTPEFFRSLRDRSEGREVFLA